MIDFTEWVIQNTVYPDVTYHDFLREQSVNHDRILEVGVHIGSSFIGMLRDRETIVATGIDAFIQTTKDELIINLKLFNIDEDVDILNIFNGYDYSFLPLQLEINKHTFVHLDADHTMEGTLSELYACHQAASVQKIVVHDLIDDRVHHAVDTFHKWNCRDWDMRIVGPQVVFNGCIVLERCNHD